MTLRTPLRPLLRLVRRGRIVPALAVALLVGAASAAGAEGPQPTRSFELFAADWMKQIAAEAERERAEGQAPPDAAKAARRALTYRSVSSTFSTRLRPTGKPAAPYVGILTYTETVWECEAPPSLVCNLVETRPITEMFPFVNGRWQY